MSHKEDFEKALDELDTTHTLMRGVVQEDLLDTIANVIGEYNNHFKNDIEAAANKLDDAEIKHSLD